MLSGKSPKSDETHLENGSATLKIIQKNILMPDCHNDYPAFFFFAYDSRLNHPT